MLKFGQMVWFSMSEVLILQRFHLHYKLIQFVGTFGSSGSGERCSRCLVGDAAHGIETATWSIAYVILLKTNMWVFPKIGVSPNHPF